MIIASLLSTMNIWADKLSDIRLSINDVYMALLMTGWMFSLMGIIYIDLYITIIGVALVIVSIWAIRTQFLVSESQYIHGMIPHHSMAIHMSKKLLDRDNTIEPLLKNIIKSQEDEIIYMKSK